MSFSRLGSFQPQCHQIYFLHLCFSLLLGPLWCECWYAWCCPRDSSNCFSVMFGWFSLFFLLLVYFLFQLLYSSILTGSFLYFLVPCLNSPCVYLLFSLIQLAFWLLTLWTFNLINYFYFTSYFRHFLSCSFSWNKFLCLLILLNFPYLYEIRWNSYVSSSWRGVPLWEHLYIVCGYPVALVGELDRTLSRSHVFPQWMLTAITLAGVGTTRDEVAQPEPGVKLASLLLSGQHHPIRGGNESQAGGAEALRFELSSFFPSKCMFSCLLAPQRGAVLEQDRLGSVLSMDLGLDCGGSSPSQSSGPFVMNCLTKYQCCLQPLQILFQVWAGSIPHSPVLLSATAALALMWSCVTEQQGLEWAFISDSGTHQGGHRKWTCCCCC